MQGAVTRFAWFGRKLAGYAALRLCLGVSGDHGLGIEGMCCELLPSAEQANELLFYVP